MTKPWWKAGEEAARVRRIEDECEVAAEIVRPSTTTRDGPKCFGEQRLQQLRKPAFDPPVRTKLHMPRSLKRLTGVTIIMVFAAIFQLAILLFKRVPGQPIKVAQIIQFLMPTQPSVNLPTSSPPPIQYKPSLLHENCDHSCLQIIPNALVDQLGNVVGRCLPKDVERHTAMLLTMLGHINPHHAVHEDYFPLAYQVRNCLAPGTDVFCKSCSGIGHMAVIFAKALKEWVQSKGDTRSPLGTWMNGTTSGASKPQTCYKEVQVVLNPLRTLCVIDPKIRYKMRFHFRSKFDTRGLGMQVNYYEDPTKPAKYLSVPVHVRARAFEVARSYLMSQPRFSFDPVEFLQNTKQPLPVVIIARGNDVTKRRQTNSDALRKAIEAKYDQACVSVVDFGGGMPILNQLETLNAAKIVIAVHGGALGNMLAMRTGSLVITQCWRSKCRLWEYDMAPLLGVELRQVEYSEKFEQDEAVVNFMVPEILELLDPYLDQQTFIGNNLDA